MQEEIPEYGEYLKDEDSEKETYYFSNLEEKINVKSREIYKDGKLEIHFPYDPEGKQKYKYISSIKFIDVNPAKINGIYKSPSYGFGFTKTLAPLVYTLEKIPSISQIEISKSGKSKILTRKIIFNIFDVIDAYNKIKPTKDKQLEEIKVLSNNILASTVGGKFVKTSKKYIKGELFTKIRTEGITSDQISETDLSAITDLIPDVVRDEKILFKTEEKINLIKLNKVKKDFGTLMKQKGDTKTLEKKWQSFFQKNSWIFANILAMPIVFVNKEAYVGGKSFENKDGKVVDFIYKNNLTKNVFLVEIKTHLKKLVSAKSYRKPDIFSLTTELSGSIVQAQDQRKNLLLAFNDLNKDNKYVSFNPISILIIGNISKLTKPQLNSFEQFRNNLQNLQIITFDELLDRTELVLKEFIR